MAKEGQLTINSTIQLNKISVTPFLKHVIVSSIFPVIILFIWEFLSRIGVFESYQLPAPSAVLVKAVSLYQSGELLPHIVTTFTRVLIGFGLGTAVAVTLSILVGFWPLLEKLIDPTIQALRQIPSLAWVPLFILWMGIGETSKVTMIAVGVFFPVYLNVLTGIVTIDRKWLEVGKVFGLSTRQKITKIILPAVFPAFFTGIRTGLGLGFMFVVAAELMGASEGLGYLLVLGQNTLQPDTILVSIILFAIIGKVTDGSLKLIEQRLLHWQDTEIRGTGK
jgi:sulfonate transport system permease protein